MKKLTFLVIVFTMVLCLFSVGIKNVYAQGNTKIVMAFQENKTEVQTGEIFKVYIKAEEALDVFGLQLTLNYDPSIIQVIDGGINIEKNMSVFGGQTEDFKRGILTYPFINTKSTDKKVPSMPVADIAFKALKKGPAVITLTDIKAVNSDIREIHYNTQYQTAFNIKEAPVKPPKDDEPGSDKPKPEKPKEEEPSDGKGGTTVPKPQKPSGSERDTTGPGKKTVQPKDSVKDGKIVSEGEDKVPGTPSDIAQKDSTKDNSKDKDGDTTEEDETPGLSKKEQDEQESEEPAEDKKKADLTTMIITIALVVVLVGGLCIYLLKNKDSVKGLIGKLTRGSQNRGV